MDPSSHNKPVVAVFDFDKTITYHDTLFPFIVYVKGRWKVVWIVLLNLPSLILFLLGLRERERVKEQFLTAFFENTSIDDLSQKGEVFAQLHLSKRTRPEALERIKWHQSQGHRCLLVSASISVYLEPWAKEHGFEQVLSTRLEINALHQITGKMAGGNCWGPEKLKRLKSYLGPLEKYNLYVYGDSRGDKEILEVANHPFYRTMQ